MLASPAPRRRWLRLSLRGLMILIVLIALPAGWAVNTIRSQRGAIAQVRAARGQITFDYEDQVIGKNAQGRPIHRREPAAPAWLRRLLGDELFQEVREVTLARPATPAVMAALAEFRGLEALACFDLHEVGAGFRHLRGSRKLRKLHISGLGVTDAVLVDVAAIQSLDQLRVSLAAATDAGFAHLAALPNLTILMVDACHPTDAGAATMLAGLPLLQRLEFFGDPEPMTATIQAIARHHPNLQRLDIQHNTTTAADLIPLQPLKSLKITGIR